MALKIVEDLNVGVIIDEATKKRAIEKKKRELKAKGIAYNEETGEEIIK